MHLMITGPVIFEDTRNKGCYFLAQSAFGIEASRPNELNQPSFTSGLI